MLPDKISAFSAVCCKEPEETAEDLGLAMKFASRLRGSGRQRPPCARRGWQRGARGAAASSLLLSACRVYFPPRDSEQVSLSLGKARRRQPICSQRRALPRASPGTAPAPQQRSKGRAGQGPPPLAPIPSPNFSWNISCPEGLECKIHLFRDAVCVSCLRADQPGKGAWGCFCG